MAKNESAPAPQHEDDIVPEAPATPPPGMVPLSAIEALGKSIGEGLAASTHRKQPFGLYDPKSSYHPDKKKTPKLKRDFYQNGYRADVGVLFDEDILLLNRLTHSGRYLERVVEVRIDDSSAEEVVHINYNNKGIEQRLSNKRLWNGLPDLLRKLVALQEAEDAEDAEIRDRRAARKR